MSDKPLEESPDNKTSQIDHSLIPDNTFTIILKSGGKVFSLGGEIGKIAQDMHDEDLDSILRALNGAGLTLQRTVAMKLANRPADYPLPGDNPSIEEDLTPKVSEDEVGGLYIAGSDIKKGQALHLSTDGIVEPINPTKEVETKSETES